jgi:hypothetical protein
MIPRRQLIDVNFIRELFVHKPDVFAGRIAVKVWYLPLNKD